MGISDIFSGVRLLEKVLKGELPTLKMRETQFADVGELKGYQKAAREYERVYNEISSEYQFVKDSFADQEGQGNGDLIFIMKDLEGKKKSFQQWVNEKMDNYSIKYHAPASDVWNALATNRLISDYAYGSSAGNDERRDYQKARVECEGKITKLKQELNAVEVEDDAERREMADRLRILLDEVVRLKMQIADLNLLM